MANKIGFSKPWKYHNSPRRKYGTSATHTNHYFLSTAHLKEGEKKNREFKIQDFLPRQWWWLLLFFSRLLVPSFAVAWLCCSTMAVTAVAAAAAAAAITTILASCAHLFIIIFFSFVISVASGRGIERVCIEFIHPLVKHWYDDDGRARNRKKVLAKRPDQSRIVSMKRKIIRNISNTWPNRKVWRFLCEPYEPLRAA